MKKSLLDGLCALRLDGRTDGNVTAAARKKWLNSHREVDFTESLVKFLELSPNRYPMKFVGVLLLLAFLAVAAAHEDGTDHDHKVESGKSNGGWVLLGSMCFQAGSESTIKIEATANKDHGGNQKILFYDDQEGSFDTAVAAASCSDRVAASKKLKDSRTGKSQDGLELGPGIQKTESITISEKYKRQWYFVASNCNTNSGVEEPVSLDMYKITSTNDIDCSILLQQPDHSGYIVGSIFTVLVALVLMTTSFCFYKRTKLPTMSTGDRTGYNEL